MDLYVRLLRSAPERGIAGSGTDDAVIVACGLAARADVILTFRRGVNGIPIRNAAQNARGMLIWPLAWGYNRAGRAETRIPGR